MTKQSRIAPFVRIVATDGKAYPIAPGTASEPSPSAGAVPTPSHGAQPSNQRAEGEAGGRSPVPSVSPIYPEIGASAGGRTSPPNSDLAIPNGGAGAPNPSNPLQQPCIPCEGQGEREWLSLDETEWRWHICEDCDGTGYAKKPYCDVCEGNLTADLFCVSCDDWASLTYVERISPTRIAL